jgi:predicted transcriptional regulator
MGTATHRQASLDAGTRRERHSMTVFPIFLTERTAFSDELDGVAGRALAFATGFEMNCKALEAVMNIPNIRRRGQGEEVTEESYAEQAIEEFCAKLEKQYLNKRINVINKELKQRLEAGSENKGDTFNAMEGLLQKIIGTDPIIGVH